MTTQLHTLSWPRLALLAGALLAGAPAQAQTLSLKEGSALSTQQAQTAAFAARFVQPAAETASKPEEFVYKTWAAGDWANETRVVRTYDGALLEREDRYAWEGDVFGDWAATGYTAYTYFEGGLVSSTTEYGQAETGPVPVERTSYSYDGAVASEIVVQVWDGAAWVNQSRTQFAVVDGQATAWEDSEWDGAAWAPTERATLVEADGDVVQTTEVRAGADWENAARTVYPGYTIDGLVAEFEVVVETLTDHEGLLFGLVRSPTSVSQEWVEGAWVDAARTSRNRWYDVFTGAIIKEEATFEAWGDGAWVPETRFVVEYSQTGESAGTPVRTSVQGHDGGAWADVYVETYVVQTDIRRVVQATQAMDTGEGLQDVARVNIDWTASATSADPGTGGVTAFTLRPNAPNPFAGGTTVSFDLAAAGDARLAVYDGLGREVAVLVDGARAAGSHSVRWEAAGLPAGVYLYRLEAGGESQTRRALLVE